MIKEMCALAGFSGNFTNHSGKVTCATRLFENNVDEQLIMRQTGHRSNAVRAYKRPTKEHDRMVSQMLQPPSPKKTIPPSPKTEYADKENFDDGPVSLIPGKSSTGKQVSLTFNFTVQ